MANNSRVKGITVKIGGDVSGLDKALQGVNSKINDTQAQLRDVKRLLKFDPGNTELLKQKQELLAKAVGDTKEPQTQSSTISAAPLGNGNVMARTTSETPEATKNSWFSQVFVEGAA